MQVGTCEEAPEQATSQAVHSASARKGDAAMLTEAALDTGVNTPDPAASAAPAVSTSQPVRTSSTCHVAYGCHVLFYFLVAMLVLARVMYFRLLPVTPAATAAQHAWYLLQFLQPMVLPVGFSTPLCVLH